MLFTVKICDKPLNKDIQLLLYENNRLTADTIISTGILETNLSPIPRSKYNIVVKSTDFLTIKATDSIPNLVPIDSARMLFPVGIDTYGVYKAEVNISFTDPGDESNYYELLIHYGTIKRNDWYTGYETSDPVLMNEGDQDYHPTSFFFSDDIFNGKSYTMKIKNTIGYQIKNDSIIPATLNVTLRSVSQTYYKYRKYYTRHSYNQQFQNDLIDIIFKGEPQNMYSNIENGFGIFAGYCETTSQIIYSE